MAFLCLVLDAKDKKNRNHVGVLPKSCSGQAWPENLTGFLVAVNCFYSLKTQRTWNNHFLLTKCSQWTVKSRVHNCVSTTSCSCSKVAVSGSPQCLSNASVNRPLQAVEPCSCNSPDVGLYFPSYCATGNLGCQAQRIKNLLPKFKSSSNSTAPWSKGFWIHLTKYK